jgi:hypothetical protein
VVSRKKGRRQATPASGPTPSAGRVVPNDEPAIPGWPDPLPDRLRWLENRIAQTRFSRVEVVRYWQKAVAKAGDAQLEGISVDTALEAAYDAGRLASTAVLATRHIRARGGQGHHEAVFGAVAALDLPGCDDILADSEGVRAARHESDYAPDFASPDDLKNAIKWARRTLPALRAGDLRNDGGRVAAAGAAGNEA